MSSFTVGVVAVFQPEYTSMCLRKILKSRLPRGCELQLIVVLNGASYEVSSAVHDATRIFRGATIITNAENRGYAAACNQILEATTSPYVAFVHNDVLVTQRCFEVLLANLETLSGQTIGIMPRTSYANEAFPCIPEIRSRFLEIKPPNKELVTENRLNQVVESLYTDLETFASDLYAENEHDPIETCREISSYCTLFRTSLLYDIGGFNESFPQRGYEDKELWLRLVEHNLNMVLCNTAFVHHHGNLSSDGEGMSFPEMMKTHSAVYRKLFEQHRRVARKRPATLGRVVQLADDLRSRPPAPGRQGTKRLLYFGSHYPPENAGGAELSLHHVFTGLRCYGIATSAITIRDRYHRKFDALKTLVHDDIKVFQVPEIDGEDLRAKFDFVMEQYEPDVVFTQSGYAYHALDVLRIQYPQVRRLFAFRHQTDITDGQLASLLREDGGTRIISNSKWMQQFMHEFCGRESNLVLPVVTPASCVVEEREKSRRSVVIGNGVLSKGVDRFIELACRLPETSFQIWGSLDPSIPQRSLPANVEHKGWTGDLRDLYREARVVLNMSADPEPFGRTLVEALFNGIPVIAENTGGPKEFIHAGGFLFNSFEQIAQVVERLYVDDEFYDSLVSGTREDLSGYNPYREKAKLTEYILEASDAPD